MPRRFSLRVEITGADQLRAVSKQLRTVADGKAMRREFTAELRRSTRPAVQSAKEGARSLPSHGRKHTGLRRRMAAAVSAQVRTSGRSAGIKVRMSRARLGDQAAPARLFDRTV